MIITWWYLLTIHPGINFRQKNLHSFGINYTSLIWKKLSVIRKKDTSPQLTMLKGVELKGTASFYRKTRDQFLLSRTSKPPGIFLYKDLEIFKLLPPQNQSSGIGNPKKKTSKNPQEVFTALQRCYQWSLDEYPERRLADAYLEESHPLHLRRTLDQSYYYMLENTRLRDQDQVVSRYMRDKLKKEQTSITMVNQLVSSEIL